MFATTHDAILLVLAAMWTIGYIVRALAFASGKVGRADGAPLILAAALVITAILW